MADLINPELAMGEHNLRCYAGGGHRWAFAVLAELKRLNAENAEYAAIAQAQALQLAALRHPTADRYEIQPDGERLDGAPCDYGADGD